MCILAKYLIFKQQEKDRKWQLKISYGLQFYSFVPFNPPRHGKQESKSTSVLDENNMATSQLNIMHN